MPAISTKNRLSIRLQPACFTLVLLLFVQAACGEEQTVWQLGKPDHNWAEFALAGHNELYAARFGGKQIAFEIGRGEAGRDWPYIQPGPDDGWAPRGTSLRSIVFDLPDAPRGVFRLKIEFVDVHRWNQPLYFVSINGYSQSFKLPGGAGDGSITDARAGKPQAIELIAPAGMLKKGRNEILLECVQGSWVQYDAVTLLCDPAGVLPAAEIESVEILPTPYFVRREGHLRRIAEVRATLTAAAAEVRLDAEAGDKTVDITQAAQPSFGHTVWEVGLPDSSEPVELKVVLTVGNRTKAVSATIAPRRKWRLYLAPSAHTDIGFTDLQPKCAERHNENIDAAIELIKQHPEFVWNLEVSWQAENYLATRDAARLADFFRLARQGRIGVQAIYTNVLTGLCSAEEGCRLAAYANKLRQKHGVPVISAMLTDLPSQEASLPMLLSRSGVRYFSCGINDSRFAPMYGNSPCWWEGPDGSRVLATFIPGYAHAARWGLDASLATARGRVSAALAEYESRANYPYDALFLHGAFADNLPLRPELIEVVRQWNERYEYPKIIFCRNAEFFEYIEKHYGDRLPVLRGSGGTYWEDGAASTARETALARNAQEALVAGETFLALAERLDGPAAPRKALEDAWRNCMLYNEHTWGAHNSGSAPESASVRGQWEIKARMATDAHAQSLALNQQGIESLAAMIDLPQNTPLVFNPSSWTRTDVLRVSDLRPPEAEPWWGVKLTVIKNVPGCGYRQLADGELSDAANPQPVEGTTIESRYYRVEFNPATGGIKSIFDKELKRELLDQKAEYGANQYVYVAGGRNGTESGVAPNAPPPKLEVSTSGPAKLRRFRYPGVGEMMLLETAGKMAPRIASAVIVYDDIKRIDFDNRLTKTLTYAKESVYFAFPLAVEKPVFRYQCPAGIVNVQTDMLPGACLDWFTVRHFVEVEGRDAAVVWTSPDAPIVCFGDIHRGVRRLKPDFDRGHVYAYVMNNYWESNYRAGQEGEHRFRFSLGSQAKSDPVASSRFGYEAGNPLVAGKFPVTNSSAKLPAATSLLSVAEPNVMIIGVKTSESGRALVVRLWEMEGRATDVHLKLDPRLPAAKAQACNLAEEPEGDLPVSDGVVTAPIRARGLATVRVEE